MPHKDSEAKRQYQHEHYLRNKELYKERAAQARRRAKERGRNFLRDYLSTHPCVDCGNTDVRVLQFDHREPEDKVNSPGQLVTSYAKLQAEVAKCDVRCANCHMIRTAEQFGWSRQFASLVQPAETTGLNPVQ